MTLLATLLVLAQPTLGPVLPAGASRAFLTAAVEVEDRLFESDFAGAAKLARPLPKRSVVVKWDESKVPAALRKEYQAQRNLALAAWRNITKATIEIGTKNPDVAFSFEPVLAKSPGTSQPAGAALFVSNAAGEPRIETVIGLKRGNPPSPMNVENVHNEVAHAMGAYFGLATTQFGGSFMGRTDQNQSRTTVSAPAEMGLSSATLRIADEIRAAIREKRVLIPTRPQAAFQPSSVDLGAVIQGESPEFEIQVTNTGNSPLELRIAPDCFCIVATRYEAIEPAASVVIKAHFDTTRTSPGHAEHQLFFTTNDLDTMSRSLSVRAQITPSYRFLSNAPDVLLMDGTSIVVDYFLALHPDAGIVPTGVSLAGLKGSVAVTPWSGEIADPALGEAARPRTGYRLRVTVQGPLPPGRSSGDLVVNTGNPKFREVFKKVYVQQGIAALPVSAYLGEVGTAPRTIAFLLSRPGRPFKVRSIQTDWEHLRATFEPLKGGQEYRVTVRYDGKGEAGPIQATLTAATDDPKQPLVTVPIRGVVR